MNVNFAASLHIDYPMLFELRNAATDRVSHCGVLEFIAEEGMIYMPYWVDIICVILYFGLSSIVDVNVDKLMFCDLVDDGEFTTTRR